ncbi:Fc.00g105540.m01.CDS01 [Cosmosporella sp. VM-42]
MIFFMNFLIYIVIILCYWFTRRPELIVTVEWDGFVTPRGNRLPDFSFSSYHASEQPLPNITVPPSVKLGQSQGDQTQEIQAALNETTKTGGGVVFLEEGNFTISSGLQIPNAVTLRGSGPGQTKLLLTQQPDFPVITLGVGGEKEQQLMRASITDIFVPIGALVITVNNTEGFNQGQPIFVQRVVTAEWIRSNGMSDLTRDGVHQTWLRVGTIIQQPNTISSVNGSQITLQFPLTDSLDAVYMKPEIVAYAPPPLSSEMGVEELSIHLSPSCSGSPVNDSSCNGVAISFASWAVDSWVRNLELTGFNEFVEIDYHAARITVQDVAMLRDAQGTGVALPFDILIKGSQVLVKDCGQYGLATAKSFSVITGSLTPGPNAILRHVTQSGLQSIFPHQRWAHGLLVEDMSVPTLFRNRDNRGSGHGWSMNGGVGWNLRGEVDIESPPLGVNWCIGCGGTAKKHGNGTFIDQDSSKAPKSLFQWQLEARGFG